MKILITGTDGYVGPVMVPLVLERGHNIAPPDTVASTAKELHELFELIGLDAATFESRYYTRLKQLRICLTKDQLTQIYSGLTARGRAPAICDRRPERMRIANPEPRIDSRRDAE